jgi:hypothetical protein
LDQFFGDCLVFEGIGERPRLHQIECRAWLPERVGLEPIGCGLGPLQCQESRSKRLPHHLSKGLSGCPSALFQFVEELVLDGQGRTHFDALPDVFKMHAL